MSATNPTPNQAACRTPEVLAEIRKHMVPGGKTLEMQLARAEEKAAKLRLRAMAKAARMVAPRVHVRVKAAKDLPLERTTGPDAKVNGNSVVHRVDSLEARLSRLERELGIK